MSAQPKKKPLFIRNKTPQPVEPTPRSKSERMRQLDETLVLVSDLKQQASLISDELSDAQKDALKMMEALGLDRRSIDTSKTNSISATVVKGVRSSIDEGILQRKLGAALWRKVTTQILDRHKLEAFIKSGEIDPMIVAGATNETPNAPYIKITRK